MDLLVKWDRDGSKNVVNEKEVKLINREEREYKKGTRLKMIWKRERWNGTVEEVIGKQH